MPIGSRYTDRCWRWQPDRETRILLQPIYIGAATNAYQQYQQDVRPPDPPAPERQATPAERARLLLESLLSAEQKAELEARGLFHVIGSRGNRYCIRAGNSLNGNVDWVDEAGQVLGRLCAHPVDLPAADAWLVQMLSLQHDEDTFVRVANVQSGRKPSLEPVAA